MKELKRKGKQEKKKKQKQKQIGLYSILQYFYKMLMWLTSYWFSFMLIINITFSFTNNHLPH